MKCSQPVAISDELFDIFVLWHSMTAMHFACHDAYMYTCMKSCLHAYMHMYIVTCRHVISMKFPFSSHTIFDSNCNAGVADIYLDLVTGQM